MEPGFNRGFKGFIPGSLVLVLLCMAVDMPLGTAGQADQIKRPGSQSIPRAPASAGSAKDGGNTDPTTPEAYDLKRADGRAKAVIAAIEMLENLAGDSFCKGEPTIDKAKILLNAVFDAVPHTHPEPAEEYYVEAAKNDAGVLSLIRNLPRSCMTNPIVVANDKGGSPKEIKNAGPVYDPSIDTPGLPSKNRWAAIKASAQATLDRHGRNQTFQPLIEFEKNHYGFTFYGIEGRFNALKKAAEMKDSIINCNADRTLPLAAERVVRRARWFARPHDPNFTLREFSNYETLSQVQNAGHVKQQEAQADSILSGLQRLAIENNSNGGKCAKQ